MTFRTKSDVQRDEIQKHKFISLLPNNNQMKEGGHHSHHEGHYKGIAKHVMRLDRTLTIYLNSGQVLKFKVSR